MSSTFLTTINNEKNKDPSPGLVSNNIALGARTASKQRDLLYRDAKLN